MVLRLKKEIENPLPTLDELEKEILLLNPIEKAADEAHQFVERECDRLSKKYGTKKFAYLLELESFGDFDLFPRQRALIAPPEFGLLDGTLGMPVYISNFL